MHSLSSHWATMTYWDSSGSQKLNLGLPLPRGGPRGTSNLSPSSVAHSTILVRLKPLGSPTKLKPLNVAPPLRTSSKKNIETAITVQVILCGSYKPCKVPRRTFLDYGVQPEILLQPIVTFARISLRKKNTATAHSALRSALRNPQRAFMRSIITAGTIVSASSFSCYSS